MEGAGVVTHFQDSPEHPGLSETVPALPAGHLGKRGGVQERGNQRGKRLEVPVQLSSQTLRKTNMQIQVVQGHAGKYMA